MKIIRDCKELRQPLRQGVATIGNFDGVHLGHRAIFRQVVKRAQELQGTSAVLTFIPHPLKLLAPERAPLLINTYAERERLIAASAIDVLITLPFTRELAALPAEEFVRRLLVEKLGLRHLIVGYDYAFGRGREGDTRFLRAQGERYGFTVEEVGPIQRDQEVYSSTRIRELIAAGMVADVVALLGRHFTLEGTVVSGAGRGRLLGFPTANLQTDKELLPRQGVYAVKVRHGEALYDGVANIGRNPTFGDNALTVEAHLLDFQGALYGETLRVYFVQRLRDEQKFASAAALTAAIVDDAGRARTVLQQCRIIEYREYLTGTHQESEALS